VKLLQQLCRSGFATIVSFFYEMEATDVRRLMQLKTPLVPERRRGLK
jgi:hypothetical protein